MQKSDEEKLQYWRDLLKEQEQSGLRIREFCKQKNITPSRYYYYQQLINNPEKMAIKREQKKTLRQTKLIPIKMQTTINKAGETIKLILPNSMQCIIPAEMDLNKIKALLAVLTSC